MQDDVLATYLTLEMFHKDKKDLLDSLIPLVVVYLGDSKSSCNSSSIRDGLNNKFNISLPEYTLSTVLIKMESNKLIKTEPVRYELSEDDKKGDLSELVKIKNLAEVLSIFKDYKKSLALNDIKEIAKKSEKDIGFPELTFICERLMEKGYLNIIDKKYSLTTFGVDLLSKLDSKVEVENRLNELYKDIDNHFKSNNVTLNDSQIQKLVLYFVRKNMRPLIQFFRTQDFFPENYVMKSPLDIMFCDYVIRKVREEPQSTHVITLKEILIGSMILLTFKRELPVEEKLKLRNVDIYLDTNFLFNILGYTYEELRRPAERLLELLKSFGFNLKIFDFTYEEAKGALSDCISKYDNIYLENVRVNSICYYLRSKGKTIHDIRLLVDNLDKIIKKINISIEKTDIKIENYVVDNGLILSLQGWKPERPRKSIVHDIAAIQKIKSIRGQNVNRIDESKAIFLTVDERLFAFNYEEMGHKLNRVTIPEVFVDRLMTNILWLIDPKSDISLESLIAACIRDIGFLKPSQWEALNNILNSLASSSDIHHRDIINLLTGDTLDSICNISSMDENERIILKKVEEGINKELQQKEIIIKEKEGYISKLLNKILAKDNTLENLQKELTSLKDFVEKIVKEKDDKIKELEEFKNKYTYLIKEKVIKSTREHKNLEIKLCNEVHRKNYMRCSKIVSILKIVIIAAYLIYFGYGLYYNIPYIKNWISIIPVLIGVTLFVPGLRVHEVWGKLQIALSNFTSRKTKKLLINYNIYGPDKEHIEVTNVTQYAINIKGYKVGKLDNNIIFEIDNDLLLNPMECLQFDYINSPQNTNGMRWNTKDMVWDENGFTLILQDKDGDIIDSVQISMTTFLLE